MKQQSCRHTKTKSQLYLENVLLIISWCFCVFFIFIFCIQINKTLPTALLVSFYFDMFSGILYCIHVSILSMLPILPWFIICLSLNVCECKFE